MRRVVAYVTIDHEAYEDRHAPNLGRLEEIARDRGLAVERVWFRDVRDRSIDEWMRDPPLALFLAGSHTEWYRVKGDADWRRTLDRHAEVMTSLLLPTWATCGSHQALARAYARTWRAVRHVRPHGDVEPRTIEDEIALPLDPNDTYERPPLAPSPRLGERGTFPLRRVADDPVFEGMGEVFWATQAHNDEVADAGQLERFVTLAEPARQLEAQQIDPGQAVAPEERTAVQLLRLRDERRIFYSAQLHPDLACYPGHALDPSTLARAREDARRLLLNFFALAERWWSP